MIFGIEYRSNFGKAVTWLIVMIILVGLLMAFFPLMQDGNFKSLLEGFNESMGAKAQDIIGVKHEIKYDNLDDYIPYLFQYLGILLAIFAMQLGAKSLSKEQSYGTIEYLYSQPISRSEILLDKWLANFVQYIVVLVLIALATFGFGYLFSNGNIDAQSLIMTILVVAGCLLGLGFVFLSLGSFYSSLSSRSSHSEGGSVLIVILILILMAVGKAAGGIYSELAGYVPFVAFNPLEIVKVGVPIQAMVANIIIGAILLGLSVVIYNGKELKL